MFSRGRFLVSAYGFPVDIMTVNSACYLILPDLAIEKKKKEECVSLTYIFFMTSD